MDKELLRIQELLSSLSEAHWSRITPPGVSWLSALQSQDYQPESAGEKEVWEILTLPRNYHSLCRYVESHKDVKKNDFASMLTEKLLSEANRRWEIETDERPKG
jgi:hypothetical protein